MQTSSPVTGRVRIIFGIVMALLVTQYFFVRHYGEPYPAIVMPSFGGSGGYRNGRVVIRAYEAVFITEDEEFSFPPKVLLEEFPASRHSTIAYNILMPRREINQAAAQSSSRLGRLRDAIFPGYANRDAARDSPENMASLRDWLQNRAQALVANQQVSRVEMRWYREAFWIDDSRQVTEREPTGILVIPLELRETEDDRR